MTPRWRLLGLVICLLVLAPLAPRIVGGLHHATASALLSAPPSNASAPPPVPSPPDNAMRAPASGGFFGATTSPSFLGGDWPSYGQDPNGSRAAASSAGIDASAASRLREAWRVQLAPVSGTPIVKDHVVYVGDMAGNVTALSAEDGTILWQTPVGGSVSGTLATADGLVYAVTLKNATLHAIDASTGDERWATPIAGTSAGWGSPLVADGRVMVGASGGDDGMAPPDHRGSVQAFDARTGELAWRTFMADEGHAGDSVWTTPVLVDGLLIFGTGNPNGEADASSDAMVALYVTNGTRAWSQQFLPDGGSDPIDDDFGSSPVAFEDAGRLLVAESQKYGGYHVLDAHTGEVVGGTSFYSEDVIGSPAVGDACILLARQQTKTDGRADCVSKDESATALWSVPMGSTFSSPAAGPGYFIVVASSGDVKVLSSTTGSTLWEGQAPGGSYSSPAIAEGHVYLGYQKGWNAQYEGGVVAYAPARE